jgi:hypothetical protein
MMYKEPIGKVVDLVKVRRIIKRLPQYQVDADVVLCYLIYGAKTHFGEQGHTRFYRMQGKWADLLIFFNEKIKKGQASWRLAG